MVQLNVTLNNQCSVVRANQKDVYYQMVLQEQMTRVAQQFLGNNTLVTFYISHD